LIEEAATVADIQDDDVKLAYKKELGEIAMLLGTIGADRAAIATA
jgi:hypothetical protein